MRTLFLAVSSASIAALAFASCSAASSGTGGAGGSQSSASSVASSTTTASASTGAGGASSQASSTTASTGAGGGCVGTSAKASPVPLDIFLMLDQSGSMLQDAGNGKSKWQATKDAITTFVNQPSAAGIGIGLQFFGLPDPTPHGCPVQLCTKDTDCMAGCTVCLLPQGVCQAPSWNPDIDSCDPLDYAWAEVPIQPLPGAANEIVATMGVHAPGTNTPTSPALAGAIDYAKAWATAHPTHVTVVAFATDGGPSECDVDLNNINAIAAAGVNGMPSVKTFVIGVGSLLAALDGIAAAGGTTQAFHVDVNPMATQQLVDALNTIRGAAVACTYVIPPPPMGQTIDYGLFNVDYLAGGKPPAFPIPNVADKAHCPMNGDGWYYDDNAMPTEIVLCDKTCATVVKDPMAEVDAVLGCKTILK